MSAGRERGEWQRPYCEAADIGVPEFLEAVTEPEGAERRYPTPVSSSDRDELPAMPRAGFVQACPSGGFRIGR